jgi:hypothetical protein
MPTVALLVALLAAPPPGLEIALEASLAPPLPDGRRAMLVVTARNVGQGEIVFLPQALSLTFTGPGARLQRYDEGPPLPPIWFEPRTLAPGRSTRLELVATLTDTAWQLSAGGGQRANWFLQRPGRYGATVRYAVPQAAVPPGTSLPAGQIWTGELTAGPVSLSLPP